MTCKKSDAKRNRATIVMFVGFRPFIFLLAIAATALGCSWSLLTEHSVRFNAFRTGRDFYRLPPLPLMYDAKSGMEVSEQSRIDYFDYEGPYAEEQAYDGPPQAPGEAAWLAAATAVEQNRLVEARSLLEKYLAETEGESVWEGVQAKRNAAYDMVDAIRALNQGSSIQAVKAYLEARNAFGLESARPETAELIDKASSDKNLKDNADYLRLALLVRQESNAEALASLEQHATIYPGSEKNDAVLYMIAKLKMQQSHGFVMTNCGIRGNTHPGEEISDSQIEPKEKCQDGNWYAAVAAFQELMQKFPHGRYYDDARGWLAHLYYRGGERAKALAEYYRMLGHPTKRSVRLEAKKSLQIIGHGYDDTTLDEVENQIATDADTAMAYAYHRIYNHAVDFTGANISPWCCTGENSWAERQKEETRLTESRRVGTRELDRVAKFAAAMIERYPNARVSAGFIVRVAEANLEAEKYSEARRLASRAISKGGVSDVRAEALWIKGSAEHQQRDFRNAAGSFRSLIEEFPNNRLTEGAHRLLAMTAEDAGDLESALEHYIALKYRYDVAYLIDVLMPTDKLAKFVTARPNLPNYDMMLYSVGVRYLREGRWNEARDTLRKVKPGSTDSWTYAPTWNDSSVEVFAKEPDWQRDKPLTVNQAWVMQDLKTIDVLESMEQAIAIAPDDETRAEAMYQLASYLFGADDLLFYNPAAWRGTRAVLLHDLSFSDLPRAPDEVRMIFDHSQSHETMARAISIYLDIARRFPNTRAGRDALYSSAVAHERLSNLNNYWRAIYEKDLFAGPRMVSYADVRSAYPTYQLPRGTDGWEPATRTVNGGPGWAAPEKAKPRETREHKIKRLLKEFKGEVKNSLANVWTRLTTTIETRVESGISWYGSMIEAAVYGILSGIGLWAVILVGINLHLKRSPTEAISLADEPGGADSRVDKLIS